jgi:hypothetical protein
VQRNLLTLVTPNSLAPALPHLKSSRSSVITSHSLPWPSQSLGHFLSSPSSTLLGTNGTESEVLFLVSMKLVTGSKVELASCWSNGEEVSHR